MQINFVDFVAGARKATGVAVVIDVFRAFTTACYCFSGGAKTVVAVGESEKALSMASEQSILLGERFGKCLPGFDYGNSPSAIEKADLTGKVVIHTTHAGTQGLVNADKADAVFTGAFVNAKATAKVIRSLKPEVVTLVRMGLNANEASDEDWLFADYFACLLQNQPVDEAKIVRALKASPYSARFFDSAQPWSPEADFECCLQFNKFNFALQASAIEADASQLRMLRPE